MDLHLRAVLPVSTLWSVDSMKEAKINPTACERLRRVAVEWLIQKRTSAVMDGSQLLTKTN
jgi:hypothetical protein